MAATAPLAVPPRAVPEAPAMRKMINRTARTIPTARKPIPIALMSYNLEGTPATAQTRLKPRADVLKPLSF